MDDNIIAAGSDYGNVHMWDISKKDDSGVVLRHHRSVVNQTVFSPTLKGKWVRNTFIPEIILEIK